MDSREFLDRYHLKESEYGITTGSAATAAALAALLSIEGKVDEVEIKTPMGEINVQVEHSEKLNSNSGRASVIKFPYNDPDVTKNLEIFADVVLIKKTDIIVKGGEGVGVVTKPGLQVPVNNAAINPTPMEMIKNNISANLPSGFGAEITIFVPDGKKLASKTLNPRLGIVNGISILGTTGFARSMNLKSYKNSFKCQIDVAVAEGYKSLVFVPGNIGDKIAKTMLEVEDDQIIQIGNFVGYMLKEASNAGVKKIILLGHAGKIIKISAGIFNTKHSIADGRKEIIAVHSALAGADSEFLVQIFKSNTTEDMIRLLDEKGLRNSVFNSIASRIIEVCNERFDVNLDDVVVVNMEGEILNSNYKTKIKHV